MRGHMYTKSVATTSGVQSAVAMGIRAPDQPSWWVAHLRLWWERSAWMTGAKREGVFGESRVIDSLIRCEEGSRGIPHRPLCSGATCRCHV